MSSRPRTSSRTSPLVFFHIRYVGKIRKFLTIESCNVLLNILVISQLIYCNALYYGLPSYLNLRLQRVPNTPFILISCTHKQTRSQDLKKVGWGGFFERVKQLQATLTRIFIVLESESPKIETDFSAKSEISTFSQPKNR